MRNFANFCFCFTLFLSSPLAVALETPNLLIPQPKHLEILGDAISLSSGKESAGAIVVGMNCTALEKLAAEEMRKDIQEKGAGLEILSESQLSTLPVRFRAILVLGTQDSNELVKAYREEFSGLVSLGREGYVIRPLPVKSREAIFCVGNSAEGVKQCAMTLSQLAKKNASGVVLPKVRVDDSPDISWRGVNKMIDYIFPDKLPHKGYVEGIHNYRDLIDNMMRVKLNTLVIHAANAAWRTQKESETDWELSAGSYKGPEAWKGRIEDVINYAHARGIRVVLLLYHTLSGRGRIKVAGRDPCGTDPDNFRLAMDEFRSYIRNWPDLDAYVIHVSEFRRCTCEVCERTPREEEFLKYLEGFNGILREHSKDTILVYCAFPESYYNWLSKEHKSSLPPAIRNFIWTDWFVRETPSGAVEFARIPAQASLLAPLSEAAEAQNGWFDDLPGRTWYWVYTAGNLDLRFPVPDFFKSRALASGIKQVESFQGEFGYQRGADFNTLALSAFAWNSADDVTRFRKAAIASLYGQENWESMVPVEVAYEKLVQDFVGMLWTIGDGWRSPSYSGVNDLLVRILAQAPILSHRIGTLKPESALVAERLKGYQDDLEILRQEALVRQHLREAYLEYELYAPNIYGIENPESTRRVTRSLKLVDEAISANRQLLSMREARATPLRPVREHQEALERFSPSMERALHDILLSQIPTRPDWGIIQSNFWSPYYAW